MGSRPMVNVYELDDDGFEQLVYREMNDAEFAQLQADEAAAAALADAPVTASEADSAAKQIIGGNLAAAGIKKDELESTYADLLGQAQSAIPYYETFVGGQAPTAKQTATAWTAFQALDQATKDRVLFNCCRSLAAMMRYLTGDLPKAT